MSDELEDTAASVVQSAEDDLTIGDLTVVLGICKKLSPEGRLRLIDTITSFFGLSANGSRPQKHESNSVASSNATRVKFSDDSMMSPKEFMLQKQARSDVERVACIAYYLTHYRDTPQFKTLDISKVNTDAAQPKFGNAALAVANATKTGYLIATAKGNKQLSAAGELFVEALPDREAARAAMASARPRKRRRQNSSATGPEAKASDE